MGRCEKKKKKDMYKGEKEEKKINICKHRKDAHQCNGCETVCLMDTFFFFFNTQRDLST